MTEFEINDTQNSFTTYVVMYKLIIMGSMAEKEDGVNYSHGAGTSCPTHLLLEAGREISDETCGFDYVFPPDDLISGLYT